MKEIKFSIICGALLALFTISCEQAEFEEMEESVIHSVTIAEMEGSAETSTTNKLDKSSRIYFKGNGSPSNIVKFVRKPVPDVGEITMIEGSKFCKDHCQIDH